MSVYKAVMVAFVLLACGRATVDLRSSAQGENEPLEAGGGNPGPVLALPPAVQSADASVSDFSPTGSEMGDPDRSDRDPDQRPMEPEVEPMPPPMTSEPPPYSDPIYSDPIYGDPGPPAQDDAGVPCSNDRECPGYWVCVNSRCEECRDNRQCYANPERSFCAELTHTCVQCLDAFYCEVTPGIPDACIDSTCQPCREDWECVRGHVCRDGECECRDGDCRMSAVDIYSPPPSGDPGGGFPGGPPPDAGTSDGGVDAGRSGSSFE